MNQTGASMKRFLAILAAAVLTCVAVPTQGRAQSISDSDFLWMSPWGLYVSPMVDTQFQWAIMTQTATPLSAMAIPLTFEGNSPLRIDTGVVTPPDVVGVTYGPAGADPAWTIRTSLVDNQAQTILLGFVSFGAYSPHAADTLCYLHFELDSTAGAFVTWVDTTQIGSNHLAFDGTSAVEWIPAWTGGVVYNFFDGWVEGAHEQADLAIRVAPNPFNSAARIEFTLQEPDEVTLSIVNLLGREVVRLVHGNLAAGPHRTIWNGHDARGRQVGSGVYFTRLHVGDRAPESRALTLLR
jgi:hypothetical protein